YLDYDSLDRRRKGLEREIGNLERGLRNGKNDRNDLEDELNTRKQELENLQRMRNKFKKSHMKDELSKEDKLKVINARLNKAQSEEDHLEVQLSQLENLTESHSEGEQEKILREKRKDLSDELKTVKIDYDRTKELLNSNKKDLLSEQDTRLEKLKSGPMSLEVLISSVEKLNKKITSLNNQKIDYKVEIESLSNRQLKQASKINQVNFKQSIIDLIEKRIDSLPKTDNFKQDLEHLRKKSINFPAWSDSLDRLVENEELASLETFEKLRELLLKQKKPVKEEKDKISDKNFKGLQNRFVKMLKEYKNVLDQRIELLKVRNLDQTKFIEESFIYITEIGLCQPNTDFGLNSELSDSYKNKIADKKNNLQMKLKEHYGVILRESEALSLHLHQLIKEWNAQQSSANSKMMDLNKKLKENEINYNVKREKIQNEYEFNYKMMEDSGYGPEMTKEELKNNLELKRKIISRLEGEKLTLIAGGYVDVGPRHNDALTSKEEQDEKNLAVLNTKILKKRESISDVKEKMSEVDEKKGLLEQKKSELTAIMKKLNHIR
ncbi:MAG: hypothetical protein MHPSP_000471, partial [Paramarteilia canceri]